MIRVAVRDVIRDVTGRTWRKRNPHRILNPSDRCSCRPPALPVSFGIGRTTVYALVKDGHLTPIHLRGCVRFSMYEIEQYIESLRRAA